MALPDNAVAVPQKKSYESGHEALDDAMKSSQNQATANA